MSARAAARLETLGFTNVYHYKPGKMDWWANGLPTEGQRAGEARAGDRARKNVPTCRLDETIAGVQSRIREADWRVCVVLNPEGIVLGMLGQEAMEEAEPNTLVQEVMDCAPTTFRLNQSLDKVREYLIENNEKYILVTTPDGKLEGIIGHEHLPDNDKAINHEK